MIESYRTFGGNSIILFSLREHKVIAMIFKCGIPKIHDILLRI